MHGHSALRVIIIRHRIVNQVNIMYYTVPDAPNIVHAIPEYSGETRLLKRIELSFNEPVSTVST
jgi:hypothetical protein